MSFQEADLETLIVNLIKEKGYDYVHGDDLKREYTDVLIEDDLRTFLNKKYAENKISNVEIDHIITSLKLVSSKPVYDANKTIFTKVVDGDNFIREDRSKKDFHLQLIDFDNIENNIFKVCNQVIIQGPRSKKIPDTIIYINGLPLIVWEYKSTVRKDATICDAFKQIINRYTREIPELFKYNAFVVISDGINSKMGSIFSSYEHFYAWRKVDDYDEEKDGINSLYTMINGLFRKDRLLDVIHNFVYFPDNSINSEVKIVANYPQYFSSRKLHANILKQQKPMGSGKGGTYFGTTGCGKSWGMVFLSRLLMRTPELSSPTIILITDRIDLDEQLSDNFVPSKRFLGEQEIESIATREDLKTKLFKKASGGIYLTTIQKFTEEIDLLSNRTNIICISDEAHRSQLNLDQKVIIDKKTKEARVTYGYAKYLHESFPNATFVGYTGTPIPETLDIFGDIVEEYTMRDSIKDGITVSLTYDGRFSKVVLDSEKMLNIEQYYSRCLKQGANEYQVEESKKQAVNIRSIIGDHNRLVKVAKFFIEHYEQRVNEGSTVAGKCMFVCADRNIAYDFYKIVKEMRPDWINECKAPNGVVLNEAEDEKLKPMPMMKMIMTRDKDDPKELYDLLGTEEARKEAALQFKDIKSNFKIAIVVDMWLTGFDVPFLDTIYIDKLLTQEHNILQTISRVNRSYPGKNSGLVVDFIGIRPGIDLALKKYAKYDEGDFEGIEKAITIVKDELEILDGMYSEFNSMPYFIGTNSEKLQCLNNAAEFIQITKDSEKRFMDNVKRMSKAFSLCNAAEDFSKDELDKIHYYIAIRSIIFKLIKGTAPDTHLMNATVKKMIQDAIKSNEIEELFSAEKDLNTSAIDLFDKKYIERINKISLPNTRLKLLQQLLNQAIDEFKKVNKIKAMTFSERLQRTVDKYNDRSYDISQIPEIVDHVADELIKLMDELRAEKDSFEDLGINYEEKAFYDVLVDTEDKYKFEYPEEKNIHLAKEIYKLVTENGKYADWLNRIDTRAHLHADIIELLHNNGFPPLPDGTIDDYTKVYNDVIEQTENFKKYYNN